MLCRQNVRRDLDSASDQGSGVQVRTHSGMANRRDSRATFSADGDRGQRRARRLQLPKTRSSSNDASLRLSF